MKNPKGQALVETAIIIFILTAMTFGALQVCVLVVNDLITNEASYAISRIVAVHSGDDSRLRTKMIESSVYLLAKYVNPKSLMFLPVKAVADPVENEKYNYIAGGKVIRFNTEIKYISRIMFGSLLQPAKLPGTRGIVERVASVRMIKSPDEEYYNRAYPGARNFNE